MSVGPWAASSFYRGTRSLRLSTQCSRGQGEKKETLSSAKGSFVCRTSPGINSCLQYDLCTSFLSELFSWNQQPLLLIWPIKTQNGDFSVSARKSMQGKHHWIFFRLIGRDCLTVQNLFAHVNQETIKFSRFKEHEKKIGLQCMQTRYSSYPGIKFDVWLEKAPVSLCY